MKQRIIVILSLILLLTGEAKAKIITWEKCSTITDTNKNYDIKYYSWNKDLDFKNLQIDFDKQTVKSSIKWTDQFWYNTDEGKRMQSGPLFFKQIDITEYKITYADNNFVTAEAFIGNSKFKYFLEIDLKKKIYKTINEYDSKFNTWHMCK